MKLKALTLADICPEDAEFTLSDGKTYTIRKFTLADQAWVQKTFGGQNTLQHAFADPENLLRIVFHQLTIEQQKQFAAIEVERVDEDTGEVVVEKLGGWRRFAASITNLASDMENVAKALTTAIVGSSALLDEEAEVAVAEEKKTAPRIGARSSTSSRASTGTASATSAR